MLKYLFKALLNSGAVIEQTQQDTSALLEGKNAFYDVMQNFDNLRAFALYDWESIDEYLVDLSDGHFEINQTKFFLHDEPISNIRLIYFRRNVAEVSLGGETGPQQTISYHLGFQASATDGSNRQFILRLV